MSSQVPEGYKQTEVGVIPEDWNIEELSNLCEAVVDCAHSTPKWTSSGVVVLRNQNIRDGKLNLSEASYTDEAHYSERIQRAEPREKDIVITREAPMGEVCLIPKGLQCCLGQRMVLLRPRQEKCIPEYFLSALQSEHIQNFIDIRGAGSTVGNLKISLIEKMPIPCPDSKEQREIASTLSDIDNLLASLDRLIAKKRDLKQATMQQLLTGKKRLPGFEGEWKVKKLGELGVFLKGRGVKKDESQSGGLPCIRYGEIYTDHNDYVQEFKSWISTEIAETATPLKKGDILFAGSGETKEEIGKCVAFVDDLEAYAGGDIVILRSLGTDAVFLGYSCNTEQVNSQKANKGQGDAVVHISASALSSIEIALPKLKEQKAIAQVLTDMDTELTTLQTRRTKTQALKQAMMQELLTGRTRLV